MAKRIIRKVAVLGSGIMGSRIACHFAGTGIPVVLLDMEAKQAADALAAAAKSTPSPLYSPEALKLISTGSFPTDMGKISQCDWVIEVVIEDLAVKQSLYSEVEKVRRAGTLITTNTSGIPVRLLAKGRSDDFTRHFCGTHFFNPPRYLQLLEIIPTTDTSPEVVDFLMHYGDLNLGKTTILCKDTPAFVANRVGVFSIMWIFRLMDKLGLGIDEIETLTGPIIGRPKSATFRTADIVGIDTLLKVAAGVYEHCPTDESRDVFKAPEWLLQMVAQNRLGDKTGQGFFRKEKKAGGEKEILTLDLGSGVYQPRKKARFATLETAKQVDDLSSRLRLLVSGTDQAAAFYRDFHYGLFSYVSHRIPEIADDVRTIDQAMKAGFGWETGAFEAWDALGVADTVQNMRAAGYAVAPWVDSMLQNDSPGFYRMGAGWREYYDMQSSAYTPEPGGEAFLVMKHFEGQTLWTNSACRLYHLGDDVVGLQWHTKLGSIGGEVLEGIQRSVSTAEERYRGLVIANEGPHFSAGANVGMIFMLAVDQEYEELDMAVRLFQQTMMRVRLSPVPVVVATHGMALGGACELVLHADKICAAAETYTGLVEVGVGLIPAGGGSKEFVLRAADEMHPDEPETITLKNRFIQIATARVATSARDAFQMGILRKGTDEVIMNQARRVSAAKQAVIDMSASGYTAPLVRSDIRVLGRTGLGTLYAGINGMLKAGFASEHDALVARKLAYVMCGGDLSEQTLVTEQYLLDLEREAFLSLSGEKKTLERLQSVLKSGKPLRN